MHLFQSGEFKLHSGDRSAFKIDCDALTDADWETLALIMAERLPPFRHAIGVPTGGLALAEALNKHSTGDQRNPILLADDIYTTGASLCRQLDEVEDFDDMLNAIGVVVFARKPVIQEWITALFTMSETL